MMSSLWKKGPADNDSVFGARGATRCPCVPKLSAVGRLPLHGPGLGFLGVLLLKAGFWEMCPWGANEMEAEIACCEMKGENTEQAMWPLQSPRWFNLVQADDWIIWKAAIISLSDSELGTPVNIILNLARNLWVFSSDSGLDFSFYPRTLRKTPQSTPGVLLARISRRTIPVTRGDCFSFTSLPRESYFVNSSPLCCAASAMGGCICLAFKRSVST